MSVRFLFRVDMKKAVELSSLGAWHARNLPRSSDPLVTKEQMSLLASSSSTHMNICQRRWLCMMGASQLYPEAHLPLSSNAASRAILRISLRAECGPLTVVCYPVSWPLVGQVPISHEYVNQKEKQTEIKISLSIFVELVGRTLFKIWHRPGQVSPFF